MARRANAFFTHPEDRPSGPPPKSGFDDVVEQLGLTPEQYATSGTLRAWVEKHKDERYVPPELLAEWSLTVKA